MKISYAHPVDPIENIAEEPPKRRRWDRWLYLAVLLVLAVSFLKWLIWPWIFNTADGLLLRDQFDVKFTDDIRIVEFRVDDKQRVQAGDTLFLYQERETKQLNRQQDSLQVEIQAQGARREIIALQTQIRKRSLFLTELKKRLVFWQEERERKEKLVYLGAMTTNELANIDRSIDDISYQMATAHAERNVLQQELVQLQVSNGEMKALGTSRIHAIETTKACIAPISGVVDRLRINAGGVCYKQETVTSIVDTAYLVKAYVDVNNLDRFVENDDVVVLLPYGNKKLQGRIKKVYSVMEDKDKILFGSLDNNKYGMVVEVEPVASDGWQELTVSNIPVKIRKGRINL